MPHVLQAHNRQVRVIPKSIGEDKRILAVSTTPFAGPSPKTGKTTTKVDLMVTLSVRSRWPRQRWNSPGGKNAVHASSLASSDLTTSLLVGRRLRLVLHHRRCRGGAVGHVPPILISLMSCAHYQAPQPARPGWEVTSAPSAGPSFRPLEVAVPQCTTSAALAFHGAWATRVAHTKEQHHPVQRKREEHASPHASENRVDRIRALRLSLRVKEDGMSGQNSFQAAKDVGNGRPKGAEPSAQHHKRGEPLLAMAQARQIKDAASEIHAARKREQNADPLALARRNVRAALVTREDHNRTLTHPKPRQSRNRSRRLDADLPQ